MRERELMNIQRGTREPDQTISRIIGITTVRVMPLRLLITASSKSASSCLII